MFRDIFKLWCGKRQKYWPLIGRHLATPRESCKDLPKLTYVPKEVVFCRQWVGTFIENMRLFFFGTSELPSCSNNKNGFAMAKNNCWMLVAELVFELDCQKYGLSIPLNPEMFPI